jgi:hypothetical protein
LPPRTHTVTGEASVRAQGVLVTAASEGAAKEAAAAVLVQARSHAGTPGSKSLLVVQSVPELASGGRSQVRVCVAAGAALSPEQLITADEDVAFLKGKRSQQPQLPAGAAITSAMAVNGERCVQLLMMLCGVCSGTHTSPQF